jgi:hypothetical protein
LDTDGFCGSWIFCCAKRSQLGYEGQRNRKLNQLLQNKEIALLTACGISFILPTKNLNLLLEDFKFANYIDKVVK